MVRSPQHEELYHRVTALGRLRTAALNANSASFRFRGTVAPGIGKYQKPQPLTLSGWVRPPPHAFTGSDLVEGHSEMRLALSRPWLIEAAFTAPPHGSSAHWKVTDVLGMGRGLGICCPIGQHGPMSLDHGNCFYMSTLYIINMLQKM